MNKPFISIIIPVKNEAQPLRNCLESIFNLAYPKDRIEVIVADGMSTDNSADIAKQYGAKVIINEKQTVSPGRNAAFKHAGGQLIAFTDADCIADQNWLKNAVKYFEEDNGVGGVGGPNLTPENETPFGKAVGFVFGQAVFAAGSVHARNLKEIKKVKSIPGCNAIYKREVLEKVMPIDESLLTCDDTKMNRKILDNGYSLLYTPDVFVWHYRRPAPGKLWKQMYRYAIGRLQAGKRDRRMINIVHIMVGIALPLGLFILIFSPVLFMFLLSVYLLLLLVFSFISFLKTRFIMVSLWVPVVISIICFSWSIGFIKELFFPLKDISGK